MRRLGVHTSIAGGLHRALLRAHALGCTAVQIFSHNPRGWLTRDISGQEADLFRGIRKELGISPVYVHASYLLNVASSSEGLRVKSVALLKEEMRRANAIGADFVVLHTGSAHDGGGVQRAISSIRKALGAGGGGAGLLIENTSGKRGDIASLVEEMAEIMDGAGEAASGICIDTCHAFAAGYDLREAGGRAGLIDEISSLIGIKRLKLIHLNDSRAECATGTDRHEHLGRGRIGFKALRLFMGEARIREVPAILETPKRIEGDDIDNLEAAMRMMEP